jgi:hypothetical protein
MCSTGLAASPNATFAFRALSTISAIACRKRLSPNGLTVSLNQMAVPVLRGERMNSMFSFAPSAWTSVGVKASVV